MTEIDECKEGKVCQCDDCTCKNTWSGFECGCRGDKLYILEHDTCIGKKNHLKLIRICDSAEVTQSCLLL